MLTRLILFIFLIGICISGNSQNKMYLTNIQDYAIQKCNLDGSNMETINIDAVINRPEDLEVDSFTQKMYWTEWSETSGLIRKANLDGSEVETLAIPGGRPRKLWLDPENQHLYWTDDELDSITKSNLDLNNIETIMVNVGLDGALGIEVDIQNQLIYWSDWEEDKVWKANLDGTNPTAIYSANSGGVLKLSNDKEYLYVTDNSAGLIYRVNVDGSNKIDLVTGLANVTSLDIDYENNYLYWGENDVNDNGFDAYCLKRINLATSAIEEILPLGSGVFLGIELFVDSPINNVLRPNDVSFSVFPNPFIDQINVVGLTNEFNYELFNLNGTLIEKGISYHLINLKDLTIPCGTYVLKIGINNQWTSKIISKLVK